MEEGVIADLRAICIANKGGVPTHRLRKEFIETGNDVTVFQKLGYQSIEEFIKRHPEEFFVAAGTVNAKLKQESAHIQSLVDGQKSNRKRGGGPRHVPRRLGSVPNRRPIFPIQRENRYPQPLMRSFPANGPVGQSAQPHSIVPPRPRRNEQISSSQNTNPIRIRDARSVLNRQNSQTVPSNVNDQLPPQAESTYEQPSLKKPAVRSCTFYSEGLLSRQINQASQITGQNVSSQLNNNNHTKSVNLNQADENSGHLYFKDTPPLSHYQDIPSSPCHRTDNEDVLRGSSRPLASENMSIPSANNFQKPPPLINCNAQFQKPAPLINGNSQFQKPPPLLNGNAEFQKPLPPIVEAGIAGRIAAKKNEGEIAPPEIAHPAPPDMPHPNSSSLEDFCKDRCLGELSICVFSETMHGETVYTAIVKVGNRHAVAGDRPQPTPESAIELAKDKTYQKILTDPEVVKNHNMQIFITNLYETLKKNTKGIWMNCLEDNYKSEFFDEDPPPDWRKLILSSPLLDVQTHFGSEIVYAASSVQPPKHPPGFEPLPTTNGSTVEWRDVPSVPPGFEAGPKTRPETLKKLPTLVPPKDDFWDVHILSAKNPSKWIVRLVGPDTSDELDTILTDLELKTLDDLTPVTEPIVGELYAAKNGSEMQRVQVTEISNGKALVCYVDSGDDIEEISSDCLFLLEEKYRDLPAQAFYVSMAALEDFSNEQLLIELAEFHVGQTLILQAEQPMTMVNDLPCFTGWVWDTTDALLNVNINYKLLETALRALSPMEIQIRMAKVEERNMIVSHIGDSVHLKYEHQAGEKYVKTLCHYKTRHHQFEPSSQIIMDKVYLIRLQYTMEEFEWVRCKLSRVCDDPDDVVVYLIDSGPTIQVRKSQLYDVATLSLALNEAPAQCIKVKLAYLENMNESQLDKVRRLLPTGTPVLAKLVNINSKVPIVDIHVRKNDAWIHVNKYCLDEGPVEPDVADDLPAPPLPALNESVNVKIMLAASPAVFTVQMDEYSEPLDDLMCQLQDWEFEAAPVPTADSLQPGASYAVLYSSNWYRGKFHTMIGSEASVELCDFGNLIITPLELIRHLPSQFKELPKQALRGTLADVIPISGDWNPSDCILFQEMVSDKVVAAIVRDIREGPVLHLQIADTEDKQSKTDIGAHFISLGIAKEATKTDNKTS